MVKQTAVQFLVMRYHQRQGYLKDDDIEQASDGDYKCSVKRKGVWIHSFGKTEMDAFHSMFDLIEEMNNFKK